MVGSRATGARWFEHREQTAVESDDVAVPRPEAAEADPERSAGRVRRSAAAGGPPCGSFACRPAEAGVRRHRSEHVSDRRLRTRERGGPRSSAAMTGESTALPARRCPHERGHHSTDRREAGPCPPGRTPGRTAPSRTIHSSGRSASVCIAPIERVNPFQLTAVQAGTFEPSRARGHPAAVGWPTSPGGRHGPPSGASRGDIPRRRCPRATLTSAPYPLARTRTGSQPASSVRSSALEPSSRSFPAIAVRRQSIRRLLRQHQSSSLSATSSTRWSSVAELRFAMVRPSGALQLVEVEGGYVGDVRRTLARKGIRR